MNAAVIDKIDKSTESFRDKILRKCGESVEMKEKFFAKYADEIEAHEPRHGEAIRRMGRNFSRWEMAAACATRSISRLSSPIRSSRNARRFRSFL